MPIADRLITATGVTTFYCVQITRILRVYTVLSSVGTVPEVLCTYMLSCELAKHCKCISSHLLCQHYPVNPLHLQTAVN